MVQLTSGRVPCGSATGVCGQGTASPFSQRLSPEVKDLCQLAQLHLSLRKFLCKYS
jgi:hypothetical protein